MPAREACSVALFQPSWRLASYPASVEDPKDIDTVVALRSFTTCWNLVSMSSSPQLREP